MKTPKDLKLKDWDEVEAFYAKHLKSYKKGPHGPIYSGREAANLRLKFRLVMPDEEGPFVP